MYNDQSIYMSKELQSEDLPGNNHKQLKFTLRYKVENKTQENLQRIQIFN